MTSSQTLRKDASFHDIWFEWSIHMPTTIFSASSIFCHHGALRFRFWSQMDSSIPHNRNCVSQYRVNVWWFVLAYLHCCNGGDVPRQWNHGFQKLERCPDKVSFPPASAVEGIKSVPSVCLWVCVSVSQRSHGWTVWPRVTRFGLSHKTFWVGSSLVNLINFLQLQYIQAHDTKVSGSCRDPKVKKP